MKSKKQKLGQFLTGSTIANFMAELVSFENAENVLDPAVGEGVFIKSLENNMKNKLQYVAYDIDEAMISKCGGSLKANVKYENRDYLLSEIDVHPDIIVCNPPYNKFQDIPNRVEYIRFFKERFGFSISGYSNLCVYFLTKSLFELKNGGKCAYIVPYEFLNTGYGEKIKKYFIDTRILKTIYKFNSNVCVFDDALTTSCILLFEKKEHSEVEFVSIDDLSEIENKQFEKRKVVSYDELNYEKKWSLYFNIEKTSPYNNLIDFSEFAKVKRGIATGGNAFFALNKDKIEELGLSSRSLVKCVCKSQDIKEPVFKETDFKRLYLANKKMHIFNGEQAENEGDMEYIEYGEKNNYNKSYLNSHRSPWYSIEKKEIAPIWISVFNRDSLKIVRNETEAKNLTTFHGVYFNDNYNCEKFINIFYCYLLTPICHSLLKKNKREYGGGLDKFEPNDLNRAQVINISSIQSDDSDRVLALYDQLKENGAVRSTVIKKLNDIFLSYLY